MNETLKTQYDSLYASKPVVYEDGPIASVVNLLKYLKNGTVLDIGGGEGRNALYLSEQGFSVTVTDISEVGLSKLKTTAKAKGLKIETKLEDVVADKIKGTFDVILFSFVLHHLDTEKAEKAIKEAQTHTNLGGINIITTFRDNGELYERAKKSGRFYPSETYFSQLYRDWDIKELNTHETLAHARRKDGTRMKNQVVNLVAQMS